jgi:hypothetical protein
MATKKNAQVHAIVDRVLRGEPWLESPWEAKPRQFGKTMLEGLRQSLESHPVPISVASAYTAARGESPLAPAAYHETWARLTLLWVSRQLLRASFEDHAADDEGVRQELWKLSSELIQATDQLNGYKTTDLGAWPTERVVDAVRESLNRFRDRIVLDNDAAKFLAGYLEQCKHIVSLLAAGKQSVDSLLRGTVVRIDRFAKQENLAAWNNADLPTKQAWVRRVIMEAAWALSDAIPLEYNGEERAKQACLWLARMACQVAARAERAGEWIPVDKPTTPDPVQVKPVVVLPPVAAALPAAVATKEQPKETKKTEAPAVVAAPAKKESKMDDKKKELLKLLEGDATDAGWRLAGKQFLKMTREPIVAFLSRQLGDDESIKAKVADFLDTDLGEALLASMLSMGLSVLPETTGDIPKRLARELRVHAMTDVGDVVADLLMGPLRQVAVMYLQNVPATTRSEPASLPTQSETVSVKVPTEVAQPVTVGSDSNKGNR